MNTTTPATPPDPWAALDELAAMDYDSTGDMIFIIVVLVWYSLGMVCMLGMQINAREETVEDCARRRATLLLETLRDQTHTKLILEELVDKQKRDRLWDIYLGTNDNTNDRLVREEQQRIRNIEKQLAVLNKRHTFASESIVTCTTKSKSKSQSTIVADWTPIENRVRVRRRSSLDQQIIERWKTLAEQCNRHQQLPWTIQKLLIRRRFRRQYRTMLPPPEETHFSRRSPYGFKYRQCVIRMDSN